MLLKIAQGVFWILAVCLMPGTAYGEGRDVLPGNAVYKVEVFRGGTWEEIFVYNARVSDYAGNPEAGYTQYTMGFALFTDSFRQPLKVRVTRRAGTFSKVEIRPLSYGIVPDVQTPNSVEFELGDPAQKVSVEFDGNRMENLFILPDLPDTAIPMGANVTYFGPGVHNAGVIRIANESGLFSISMKGRSCWDGSRLKMPPTLQFEDEVFSVRRRRITAPADGRRWSFAIATI